MNEAKFIMMVGPSYSGKSTLAEKIAKEQNGKVFSSDAIRAELFGDANVQKNPQRVFDLLHKRVVKHLKEGGVAIYDATNLSCKRRMSFLRFLQNSKVQCEKEVVVVVASLADINERRMTRERVVPEEVVNRQLAQFQCPSYYEGWDKIILRRTSDYNSCMKCFDMAMVAAATMAHDNPHHTFNIGGHMQAAARYAKKKYTDISPELFLAVRYHDVGKVYTKQFKDSRGEPTEIAHFYGHQGYGAYLILMLDCPEEQLLRASVIIQWHMEHYIRDEKAMRTLKDLLHKDGLDESLDIMHECDKNAH